MENSTKNMAEHQRDELMKKIEIALGRQERFRAQQRKNNQFVPQPILVTAWLNKKRWLNDIVLEGEDEKPEVKSRKCDYPGCTDDVHGPSFKQCAQHLYMAVQR